MEGTFSSHILVGRLYTYSAMGFPVRIEDTGKGINLFPKWRLVWTGNRNREHVGHSSVWSPCKATRGSQLATIFLWDIVAHRVSWKFGSNFTGFHCLQKTGFHCLEKRVFRRTSVQILINLRPGVKYLTNVRVSCMLWLRGGPTGRSLWRYIILKI